MIDLDSLKNIYGAAVKQQEQQGIALEKQRKKDQQNKLEREFKYMISELRPRLEFAASYLPSLVVGWFGSDGSVELLKGMENSRIKRMLRTEFHRGVDGSIVHTPLLAERYQRDLCGNLKRLYDHLNKLELNPVLRISATPNIMNKQRKEYVECVPVEQRPGQQDMYEKYEVLAPKPVKKAKGKSAVEADEQHDDQLILGIEVAIVWG
jgi:hypothetical protein